MSATMMISLAGMSERFVGFGDTVAFTHTVKDDSGKGRDHTYMTSAFLFDPPSLQIILQKLQFKTDCVKQDPSR